MHGSTTEEDIVGVFTRATAALAEPDAAEVYVFLDEINTCAHMGLLCDQSVRAQSHNDSTRGPLSVQTHAKSYF